MKAKFKALLLVCTLLAAFPALAAEKVYFYHTDPAGTPLAMTDSNGSVVWRADYKPFGEENTVAESQENNKEFVGKEKDDESGLYYFGARYMNPKTGRFAAIDPVGAVDERTSRTNEKLLLNPQSLNPYAYSLNNPYRFVDPDGKNPVLIALGVFLIGEMIQPQTMESPVRDSFIDRHTEDMILIGGALEGVGNIRTAGMMGERGVKFPSKTVWKNERARIDVENPNPGQRPGQIHYQEGNEKYLYDPNKKTFQNAPNRVNDLLNKPDIQKSISKAMKYLGE